MANNFELNFDADAWVPDATNHPDRGVDEDGTYLAFDPGTPETVYSHRFLMPASYASGTLNVDIVYAMAAATSGTVEFEISVESIADGETIGSSSWDTANDSSETVPGTAELISVLTKTLTNKDSVAAGELMRLRIARDADDGTNDTAAGDAHIYSVRLYEVTA